MMMRFVFLFFPLFFALNCFAQESQDDILELFEQAIQLNVSGHKDSAKSIQQLAIVQLSQQRDSTELTGILVEEGKKCEQKGHYALALIYYLKTINIASKTHQRKEEGLAYLGLSNVNFRMANNNKSLSYGIEAAKLFQAIGNTTDYITASMLIAQLYITLSKYDDAMEIYLEMLALAENAKDSVQIADNLDHIGVIYSFKGQFDEALPYHEKARKLNIKINNQINLSINYANIGEIYLRKKQYNDAIDYLTKGLEIAGENEFRSLQIFIYYTLGDTYSILNRNNQAIGSFNKSLELIDELGEYKEKPHVYSLLSQHYERQGDSPNALAYYQKFYAVSDSLQQLDLAYKTEELKIVYDIDKHEQEIKSVMLQQQLQQNELDSSKETIQLQFIIISLVALGLICTTIFGIYIYQNQRKLRRANNTKTVLFSIIGHDLSGPVGNMKKLIDLLDETQPKDRKTIMEMLQKTSTSVFELLKELLEWSKSINKKSTTFPTDFYLSTTVRKALDVMEIMGKNKMIELHLHVSDKLKVHADENQIYTVLRNLISNAVKFTPEKGSVWIETVMVNNSIKIIVRDNGIGIEPQTLRKIQNNEFVNSTYGTKNEKGSGLGLLLCQEFLKSNKSSLHAEGKVGAGSTFSFLLPKALSS